MTCRTRDVRRSSDVASRVGFYGMAVGLYDPALGRFLEVDPIGGGELQRLRLRLRDPINAFDLAGTSILSKIKTVVTAPVKMVKVAAKVTVDVAALVPYAVYYGSYNTAKAINSVGDAAGPIGHVAGKVAAAPLALPQALGLGLDVAIDAGLKREPIGDEGKRGYINPLHSFLPQQLRGPQVYLPGVHGNRRVDFAY